MVRKSSGIRKRVSNKNADTPQFSPEQDKEIALAVCQVVKDLVCQVADEPYGELRKRPTFSYVLRKFVKDAVQAAGDAAAEEILLTLKKTRAPRGHAIIAEETELPYGMDLVWGIVLSEMEKMDKISLRRQRARVASAQKAARRREQKRQEELEAANAMHEVCGTNHVDFDTSSDEEHGKKKHYAHPFVCATDPPLLSGPIPSASPRSDDSDWAVPRSDPVLLKSTPVQPRTKSAPQKQRALPVKQIVVTSQRIPTRTTQQQQPVAWGKTVGNYPIFNQRGATRGRGRGRPRSVGSGLGRSSPKKGHSSHAQPMHPNVTLVPSPAPKRVLSETNVLYVNPERPNEVMMVPVSDFETKSEDKTTTTSIVKGSSSRGRAKGTRGKRGASTWNFLNALKKEHYEQHQMAEMIETSGDSASASQESVDEVTNTINEVVRKVNEISEMKKDGNETKSTARKMPQKRSIRKPSLNKQTPTSSGMKKMKVETDLLPETTNCDEERPSSSMTLVLDSSIDEPSIKASAMEDHDMSNSDICILEE